MSHDTSKQSVLFEGLSKKAVIAKFDQDHASSDGGAVLLKAYDEKLKLSETLAACLSDDRQQLKITHALRELFQRRLFGIACGYADGNDAARLANDPVMKLLTGRDPIEGESLAAIIGVSVERVFVRKMKTKWGSCNPERRSIRLNTDLAKKPPPCLEYIFVHELTHLREKTHNRRFTALMDQFMPQWRDYREMLNASPLTYEDWASARREISTELRVGNC